VIARTARLRCTPPRAFTLFTERASDWWPPDLRHTDDAGSEIRMLPEGRFYERAGDGTEVELGRVTTWEPPARVELDFYPGTDTDHPTRVTVRFEADGEGTRVLVEHRPGPASTHLWEGRAPSFERSWTLVLAALGSVALPDS
jgi:hypothetical protein